VLILGSIGKTFFQSTHANLVEENGPGIVLGTRGVDGSPDGNIGHTLSSYWPCDLAKENGLGIVFILDHVT
jgi:hypothetical protein